jgi:hypothetical protein
MTQNKWHKKKVSGLVNLTISSRGRGDKNEKNSQKSMDWYIKFTKESQ